MPAEVAEISPVLGFLAGALLALVSAPIGAMILRGWISDFPASARWGLSGAIGLGVVGLVTFFVGLLGGLHHGYLFAAAWLIAGVYLFFKTRDILPPPKIATPAGRMLTLVILLFIFFRVPSALVPSLGADWDSISHQLAMSKIWLLEGRITDIFFMHHSHVPANVNMLYIWGLALGGQAGAKVFGIAFAGYALLALGGLASYRYGKWGGYVSALAFISAPVVLWELGTAYVDVAHGLYVGCSIIFASLWTCEKQKKFLVLSALFMGLGLSTKYTAFQVLFAIVISLIIVESVREFLIKKHFESEPPPCVSKTIKASLLIAIISLVISSPWYIRNIVTTGNPVYPFFYEVFGSKNWNQAAADAYRAEQKRFGIGQTETGKNPFAFPGSITALNLHPDKHINSGAPWGAAGVVFLLAIALWCISGRITGLETSIVTIMLFTFLTWFFLTQQSRYITGLLFAGCFLAGGLINFPLQKWLISPAVVLQCAWSVFLFGIVSDMPEALKHVIRNEADEVYLSQKVRIGNQIISKFPFWEATKYINENLKQQDTNVALYDEVRGFYLNVNYYWANPGHHTAIPHEQISTTDEWIAALKSLGTTHVFLNLDPAFIGGKQSSALINAILEIHYSEDYSIRYEDTLDDIEPFRQWIIKAFAEGKLALVEVFPPSSYLEGQQPPPGAVLFEIVQFL